MTQAQAPIGADPFAAFRADDVPQEHAFAKLDKLVKDLTEAEKDVTKAETALKKAQAAVKQLDEFDIPEHLDTLGIKEFINKAGVKVAAVSTIRASIGNRKAAAFAWLINNKHSALIKRTVSVAFNTLQGADAKKLVKEINERDDMTADVKEEMKVEASSLTAFVKKQLADGKDIPHDIFGIYEQRATKITLPRV